MYVLLVNHSFEYSPVEDDDHDCYKNKVMLNNVRIWQRDAKQADWCQRPYSVFAIEMHVECVPLLRGSETSEAIYRLI